MIIDMHLQTVYQSQYYNVNFGPDFESHRSIFYLSFLMQQSIK